MLVATRDPMHPTGAHDPSSRRDEGIHLTPPRATRMMSVLQLAGSFLAIPVALGSAYSIYQANFSPDTQCQQLRSNIIAMIDKKIDAATRRMLVRRDVETFEKSCGAFDPDAKAAFVTLLQAESRIVPPRPVATPKAEAKPETKPEPVKVEAAKVEPKAEAPAKEVAHKAEPRPVAVVKHAPAEAETFDPAVNDARWLDAVRGALVSHEAARETVRTEPPPVLKTTLSPERTPMPAPPAAPAVAAPVANAPAVAPALPPATAVAAPPRAERVDPNRPVPPGSIPDAPPLDIAKQANGGSSWVSSIPFVGQMLDK